MENKRCTLHMPIGHGNEPERSKRTKMVPAITSATRLDMRNREPQGWEEMSLAAHRGGLCQLWRSLVIISMRPGRRGCTRLIAREAVLYRFTLQRPRTTDRKRSLRSERSIELVGTWKAKGGCRRTAASRRQRTLTQVPTSGIIR